jgi:hypothetical protein
MTRRNLLVASAMIASAAITACSDMTAPAEMQPSGLASFAVDSRQCPAPGTGLAGASNMLLDPTMTTIPMVRDAPQGNAGMFHAVAVSGC